MNRRKFIKSLVAGSPAAFLVSRYGVPTSLQELVIVGHGFDESGGTTTVRLGSVSWYGSGIDDCWPWSEIDDCWPWSEIDLPEHEEG